MTGIKRILCAVDLSRTSEHALDFALQLAATLQCDLRVVYVFSVGEAGLMDDVLELDPDTVLKLQERLRYLLEEMLARHAGTGQGIESLILQGEASAQIGAAARELQADMIVMGTRGRGGIEHMLVGSVAEKVIRTAPVPVITVPLGS